MSALTDFIATNMINKRVRIELKNSVVIEATLAKVDPLNLNSLLQDITSMGVRRKGAAGGAVAALPHGQALKSMFVRGSTILFIDLMGPKEELNTAALAEVCQKAIGA